MNKNINYKPRKFYYMKLCKQGLWPPIALIMSYMEIEYRKNPVTQDMIDALDTLPAPIQWFEYKFEWDDEDVVRARRNPLE